jgi:hypothetical protein
MFKGISPCILAVRILHFGLFNPFHYSPLPLYLPLPTFSAASFTLTDVMFYDIDDALFLSLLPQVP